MKNRFWFVNIFWIVFALCLFCHPVFSQVIDPYELSLKARDEALQKNYEFSKKIYKSILKNLDSKHKESLLGLVEIELWQDHFKNAKICLNTFLKNYPNDPQGLRLKKQIQKAKLLKAKYKVRFSHYYEDLSFADSTHHPKIEFHYTKQKKWAVGGYFSYWDKFSSTFYDFGLSGSYWVHENTVLSFQAAWAFDQPVNPEQAYQLQIDQVLFKNWVPSLAYKFSDYQDANVHVVVPGFTWYFLPRWHAVVKYYLSLTDLTDENFINHAIMTKVGWNPVDPLTVFAGYSHTNEDFESGSPFNPFGSFSAHHVFSGAQYQFLNGLGCDASFNYETRSNDTHVLSFETGIFFKW